MVMLCMLNTHQQIVEVPPSISSQRGLVISGNHGIQSEGSDVGQETSWVTNTNDTLVMHRQSLHQVVHSHVGWCQCQHLNDQVKKSTTAK